MVNPLRLTAAVRCFPVPVRQVKLRKGKPSGWRRLPLGARVLVFDTETTTDSYQNLTFGTFQVHEFVAGEYRLVHEGLFVGEILSGEQRRVVDQYAASHGLIVFSRADFVRMVFYPEVYGRGTLCVGFNLPFDLSRLAVRWGAGRGRWADGFALYLVDSKWVPALHIRSLSSTSAFIEFASCRGYQRREAWGHRVFPGRFLDLRTLSNALSGEKHSLQSACQTWAVEHPKHRAEVHGLVSPEYLDYNRRDVQATWELFLAQVADWNRHPFARVPTPVKEERARETLLITHAYSPATLGKAYLMLMGIQPRLEVQPAFSKHILGRSMAAYYGGRSEVHMRRQVVPVTYLDVLSMYPTICTLTDLFQYVTGGRVSVKDATRGTRAVLESVTLDHLYDQNFWKHLFVLAEVEADDDILPLRTQHQEDADYQIGLNHISAVADLRLCYMLPDLIAAKLLLGKAPRIRRAWRFRAEGIQVGLRATRLLGEVEIDPRNQDFFRAVIERRHELQVAHDAAKKCGDVAEARRLASLQHGLKILANSMGYGIFAEVNEHRTGAKEVQVFGLHHFVAAISREEQMGKFAFPPIAALVTSGARLILTMLEVALRARGGTYAFCDTDSAAMVAQLEVVQAIRTRFRALTPYAFGGDLLKLEPENQPSTEATRDRNLYFFGISAKRYALFNVADNGEIIVRKGSEHGLGYLLAPDSEHGKTWTDEAWGDIVRWASEQDELARDLHFADKPAVGRAPITKPSILALFSRVKKAETRAGALPPYTKKVKPFNFLLVAYPETGDITTGGEAYWPDSSGSSRPAGKPIRPVAPYESDPRKWAKLQWVDLHTGKPVRLAWRKGAPGMTLGAIPIKTYQDVLRQYVTHPEAKAAGPDGRPCGPFTTGELTRLRVHVTSIVHIGKESHELDEVQAGLTPAVSTYVHYFDERTECEKDKQTVGPVPRRLLAKWLGLHERSVKAILNTSRLPHPKQRRRLREISEKLRRRDPELITALPPQVRKRLWDKD